MSSNVGNENASLLTEMESDDEGIVHTISIKFVKLNFYIVTFIFQYRWIYDQWYYFYFQHPPRRWWLLENLLFIWNLFCFDDLESLVQNVGLILLLIFGTFEDVMSSLEAFVFQLSDDSTIFKMILPKEICNILCMVDGMYGLWLIFACCQKGY